MPCLVVVLSSVGCFAQTVLVNTCGVGGIETGGVGVTLDLREALYRQTPIDQQIDWLYGLELCLGSMLCVWDDSHAQQQRGTTRD